MDRRRGEGKGIFDVWCEMSMREIKFRAWTDNLKDGGAMYYGYEGVYNQILFTPAGYGLLNPTLDVMQFTGLHDKNGKASYEGDLVKRFNSENASEIVWNEQDGSFWLKGSDGLLWIHLPVDIPFNWEVIGNIYENPELLKKEV